MLDDVSNAFFARYYLYFCSADIQGSIVKDVFASNFIPCACACGQVQQGDAGEAQMEVPGAVPDEHGAFHDAGSSLQGGRLVPATGS